MHGQLLKSYAAYKGAQYQQIIFTLFFMIIYAVNNRSPITGRKDIKIRMKIYITLVQVIAYLGINQKNILSLPFRWPNTSTTVLMSTLLARPLSMQRSPNPESPSWPKVDLRQVLSLLKHENDFSTEQDVAGIVARVFATSLKRGKVSHREFDWIQFTTASLCWLFLLFCTFSCPHFSCPHSDLKYY